MEKDVNKNISDSSPKTKREDKLPSELSFATKEAFNLLRTNITFALAKEAGCRVIGVTSPCPQEGKTFISINLAYALAEAGFKVILIDGDMRRPTVCKKIGRPMSPGLSNLLVGVETNVVHEKVFHENLCMMMSGDIPPNPSELLGSGRMESALKLLGEKFDYVILDLPPVEAVSDPLVVSKYLDGMVLVVKQKYSRRRDVNDVVRQLKFTGVRILGFVYNTYEPVTNRTSKYYYRGKSYYEKAQNNNTPKQDENSAQKNEVTEHGKEKKKK